jgi:hypothetical protein
MTDKIKVLEIESITPGARHVWYKTNIGRIKKPLGMFDNLDFSGVTGKTVFVERELLNWGRWLVKCTVKGLGYPTQSTTVTATQGSPATNTPILPTNPDAERVDGIVKRIERDHKTWADVLKKHYTRADSEKAEDVAAEMELAKSTYFYYLNMARKKIEFYLKKP